MIEKDNYNLLVLKNSKKELISKTITSIFDRTILLIIPIYWSKVINNLSEGYLQVAYRLIVITLIISILYYIMEYLNEVTWFKYYEKLYLEYNKLICKNNKNIIKDITLAEYTNIINNDIDIISTFISNLITRIIQILEFIILYIYFISININIFIITITVSIFMILLLLLSGRNIKKENIQRKTTLDKKTITTNEIYTSLKENKYNNEISRKYFIDTKQYLKSNTKFNLLSNKYIYIILTILESTKYFVIIYSVYLLELKKIEVGTILLIYTYYDKIITNFSVLGTINAEYQSFIVSLKRLNKLGYKIINN